MGGSKFGQIEATRKVQRLREVKRLSSWDTCLKHKDWVKYRGADGEREDFFSRLRLVRKVSSTTSGIWWQIKNNEEISTSLKWIEVVIVQFQPSRTLEKEDLQVQSSWTFFCLTIFLKQDRRIGWRGRRRMHSCSSWYQLMHIKKVALFTKIRDVETFFQHFSSNLALWSQLLNFACLNVSIDCDIQQVPCSLSVSSGSLETPDFFLVYRWTMDSSRSCDDGHLRYF